MNIDIWVVVSFDT